MTARQVAPYFPLLMIFPGILLWYALVALLVRPFGVQLPINHLFNWGEKRAAFRRLTFAKHIVVFGVLFFGGLMFVNMTIWDYLDWRFWGGSYHRLSVDVIFLHAATCLGLGVLLGVLNWKGKRAEPLSHGS